MKILRKFFEFPNFYSLSVIFAIIGSCLIFIPPLIPTSLFENFINEFFRFPRIVLVEMLFNALASLGIEFYGGAILAFAFGIVDEKESLAKQRQHDEFQSQLFSKIEELNQKVSELCSVIEKESDEKMPHAKVKRNHWLWTILFG